MTNRQPTNQARPVQRRQPVRQPTHQPISRRRRPTPEPQYYEEYEAEPIAVVPPEPVDHSGKVIVLQWVVIAVLVMGTITAGWLMVGKLNSTLSENNRLTGNANSLKEQLRQAKLQIPKTPTPTPVPTIEP